MDAIAAAELTKTYDGKAMALDKLTFRVPQGGVCGFLGPNGAGKTTTVKLLTGLLRPTSGEGTVLGLSPAKEPEKVHAVCGVLTETAKMYGEMTGLQNLVFFAQMAGVPARDAQDRAVRLLKELDLWDARDKKARQYSTGMAQRLSLARVLVHGPQVLFLDEPTSGLDPESAQAVNGLIAALARREGVTVFLCTHQLRYAQDLCDSYGILEKGRLLASGDFEALCRETGCSVRAGVRLSEDDSLPGFSGKDGWWETEVAGEEEMPPLLRKLIQLGHDIYEARLIRPTLEDVYFKCLAQNGEETGT